MRVLILLVLSFLVKQSVTAAVCHVPVAAESIYYPYCADVVQYPFFLANGAAVTDLPAMNSIAMTAGSNALIGLLSDSCKVALRQFICGQVFTQCDPVTSNPITMCNSVCLAVTTEGTSSTCPGAALWAAGVFNVTGTLPSGTTASMYCNNAAPGTSPNCNSVPNTSQNPIYQAVQPSTNTYTNTTGVCYGLISSYMVSPYFPWPLTSLYIGQTQVIPGMEAAAASKLAGLPKLPPHVTAAVKLLVCNTIFMPPQSYSLSLASLGLPDTLSYSLPQFLCQAACVNAVGLMAPFWQTLSVGLGFTNCQANAPLYPSQGTSSPLNPNMLLYPLSNQTLLNFAGTALAGANIPTYTSSSCNAATANFNSVQGLAAAEYNSTLLAAALHQPVLAQLSPALCMIPSLSLARSSMNFCGDVVNYPFYVPFGTTAAQLDAGAAIQGSNSLINILPETCKPYLKQMICSVAFTKCDPSVNPPTLSIPCASVCEHVAVGDASSQCPGSLLVAGGVFGNIYASNANGIQSGLDICTKTGMFHTGTDGICNDMTQSPAYTLPLNMTYTNKQGVCYGLVNNFFPVAPWPLSPLAIAPIILSGMEASAAAQLASVPNWLTAAGQNAIRTLACYSVFMPLEQKTFILSPSSPLIEWNFNFPKFMCQSACNSSVATNNLLFSSPGAAPAPSCTNFITSQFAADNHLPPYLIGLPQYPVANQILLAPPTGAPPQVTALFNKLLTPQPQVTYSTCNPATVDYNAIFQATGAQVSAQPVCPYPLVIPDHPGTFLIGPSACSTPCPYPLGPPDQMNALAQFQSVWVLMNGLPTFYLLLTYVLFKKKREQYIPVRLVYTSVGLQFAFYIPHLLGNTKSQCMDNSLGWQQQYTFTSIYGFACTAQAFLVVYVGLSCCIWWFCQALYMYLKVVKNLKDNTQADKQYKLGFEIAAWGYPAFVCIVMLACQQFGFRPSEGWCFIIDINMHDIASGLQNRVFYFAYLFFYGPIALLEMGGTILMWNIFYEIFKVKMGLAKAGPSGGVTSKLTKDLWTNKKKRDEFIRIYRTPVLFLFMFCFTWFFIFAFRLDVDFTYVAENVAAETWVSCLLKNANATDPMHASTICGLYQGETPSIFLQFMIQFVVIGVNFWLCVIYGFNQDSFDCWAELIETKLGYRTCHSKHRDTDEKIDLEASTSVPKVKDSEREASTAGSNYEMKSTMIGKAPSSAAEKKNAASKSKTTPNKKDPSGNKSVSPPNSTFVENPLTKVVDNNIKK